MECQCWRIHFRRAIRHATSSSFYAAKQSRGGRPQNAGGPFPEVCATVYRVDGSHNDWKLRPAARLLGISPVKLRQDFRQYLEGLLDRQDGSESVEEVARALDMPVKTLSRKLVDLGVTDGAS